MNDTKGQEIAEALREVSRLIEEDQFSDVAEYIRDLTMLHPEWVDQRFHSELQLVTKQMEYKTALKDFSYLRSIALAYHYCRLNYAICEKNPAWIGNKERLPEEDTIWWCWLQGFENAPEIVKVCYSSLKRLGKRVILLEESNLQQYVSLPEIIVEKYHKGIIRKAHFTDLIRLELLTNKGGTWIDATAWISSKERILPMMEGEDLFLFRSGNVSEYLVFDNWFIHAGTRSAILEATKKMLLAYWEKENEAKHYFIFHLFLTLACQLYPEEYQAIPIFSNEPCHVLQRELFHPYQEKRWKQILEMSDVHKLTYQLEEENTVGTFYEYLLKTEEVG